MVSMSSSDSFSHRSSKPCPFAPPSLVFVDITDFFRFNDALLPFVSFIRAHCFVFVVLSPVVSNVFPVSHVIRVNECYQ